MKKYILSTMIVSMLVAANMAIAMEKGKKKEMPKTVLSSKQVAELRKAVENYKKDINSQKQYEIISMYAQKYPNDSFVQSKFNETARSYVAKTSQNKKESAKKESIKPQAKKEHTKQHVAKKEVNAVKTSLTAKQQAELKKAVQGIKDKPLSESRKEQLVIQSYLDELDAGDPFVKAQLKEASKIYRFKKYGPDFRDFDDSDSEDDID